jgi:hypothetical protein
MSSEYLAEIHDEATFIIKIKRIPKGPAPWCIRRAWVGIELAAIRNPSDVPQFDSLKQISVSVDRNSFLVPRDNGLDRLKQAGKNRAYKWFSEHWPEDFAFSFGINEVEYEEF